MNIGKVAALIHVVRGRRVMLDSDLASLYGVGTGNLNKAVTRNRGRFPADFMFKLGAQEQKNLRFHFGISSWGGRRYAPRVFTELGVAMLSSVLNSERAVRVNIEIMRAFVKLRRALAAGRGLPERMRSAETAIAEHDRELTEHAAHINQAFAEIRRLGKRPAPRS